jgi:hypothetical protein
MSNWQILCLSKVAHMGNLGTLASDRIRHMACAVPTNLSFFLRHARHASHEHHQPTFVSARSKHPELTPHKQHVLLRHCKPHPTFPQRFILVPSASHTRLIAQMSSWRMLSCASVLADHVPWHYTCTPLYLHTRLMSPARGIACSGERGARRVPSQEVIKMCWEGPGIVRDITATGSVEVGRGRTIVHPALLPCRGSPCWRSWRRAGVTHRLDVCGAEKLRRREGWIEGVHVAGRGPWRYVGVFMFRWEDGGGSVERDIVADEITSGEPSETTSDVSSEILRDIHPTSKLFVLFFNEQDSVKRNIGRLQGCLAPKTSTATPFLTELALTPTSKRTKLQWKLYDVDSSVSGLREKLSSLPPVVRSSSSVVSRVAFVFTGQGAQWHATGKGLSVYTTFANSFKLSEILLKSFGCSWSLAEELSRTEAACKPRETDYSQSACTTLQITLVELLNDFIVHLIAVLGHSSGEIAAAYTAGIINQEAAMKISWLRGQVSKTVPRNGGKLAVSASADGIQHHLDALENGVRCWMPQLHQGLYSHWRCYHH